MLQDCSLHYSMFDMVVSKKKSNLEFWYRKCKCSYVNSAEYNAANLLLGYFISIKILL